MLRRFVVQKVNTPLSSLIPPSLEPNIEWRESVPVCSIFRNQFSFISAIYVSPRIQLIAKKPGTQRKWGGFENQAYFSTPIMDRLSRILNQTFMPCQAHAIGESKASPILLVPRIPRHGRKGRRSPFTYGGAVQRLREVHFAAPVASNTVQARKRTIGT